MPPIKVAIIGSGAAGLVMAKNLLYPPTLPSSSSSSSSTTTDPPTTTTPTTPPPRFHPTVLTAHTQHPGGLWSRDSTDLMRPDMRVNHSKWGCTFSDFGFDDVAGEEEGAKTENEESKSTSATDFPTATQMGQYLRRYTERYGIGAYIRWESRVVGVRLRSPEEISDANSEDKSGENGVWEVTWEETKEVQDSGSGDGGGSGKKQVHLHTGYFDKLAVCTGFFARPWMPSEGDVPGLEGFVGVGGGRALHSSAWREIHGQEKLEMPEKEEVSAEDEGKKEKVEKEAAAEEEEEVVLVVGGLISGVEIAAELALQNHVKQKTGGRRRRIIHVFPRPPWTLPMYLPAPPGTTTTPTSSSGGNTAPQSQSQSPPFLPVDFLLYNALGFPSRNEAGKPWPPPPPETMNEIVNGFLRKLTGNGDQSCLHPNLKIGEDRTGLPVTTGISDTYANAVRSGEIEVLIGYLESLTTTTAAADGAKPAKPATTAHLSNNQKVEKVDKVIFATGYRPDLSFFSDKIKQELGILEDGSKEECFLPALLWEQMLSPALITYSPEDSSATSPGVSSAPPVVHGAFIAMYKGPYFGVMEQQAIYASHLFSGQTPPPPLIELNKSINEARSLRDMRMLDDGKRGDRQQWSTAGFLRNMDTLQELIGVPVHKRGIEQAKEMAKRKGWGVATVVPAHYRFDSDVDEGCRDVLGRFEEYMDGVFFGKKPEEKEVGESAAVEVPVGIRQRNAARAVFRSFHGEWDVNRTVLSRRNDTPSGTFIGKARFIPRKTSFGITRDESGELTCVPSEPEPGNDAPELGISEYLYAEYGTFTLQPQYGQQTGFSFPAVRKYIYRFHEGRISAWFVKPSSTSIPSSTPPPLSLAHKEEGVVDYFFHEVEFSSGSGNESGGGEVSRPGQWRAKAREKHLCEKDLYSPRYVFGFGIVGPTSGREKDEGNVNVGAEVSEMEIGYDVIGPRKDYSSWGRYTRG